MLRVATTEGVSLIEGKRSIPHLAGVFSVLVDMYSTLSLKRDCWLTSREKEFFVAFAIVTNLGLDHSSDEAKQIYESLFKDSSNKYFHNYLVKLKNKGWVQDLRVPDLFYGVGPNKHQFKINVVLDYAAD